MLKAAALEMLSRCLLAISFGFEFIDEWVMLILSALLS